MSNKNQDFEHAARQFFNQLKELQVPDSSVKDEMLADKQDDKPLKGAGDLLKALATFVDKFQPLESIDANKAVISRILGDKTENLPSLSSLIANVAIEGNSETVRPLKAALQLSNGSVFEQLRLAVKGIAREYQLSIENASITNEDGDTPPLRPSAGDKLKDKDTWRESLHKTDDISDPASDKEIERSAAQGEEKKPPITKKDIESAANEGVTFTESKREKTEYEHNEDRGIPNEHSQIDSNFIKMAEAERFLRLFSKVERAYLQTIGAVQREAEVERNKSGRSAG